jgi:ribosomal protein S18 acetylase RimI-like enzyme
MNYNIRKAIPADINEITALCVAHAEYEKANYEPKGKTESLEKMLFCQNPQLHCLIAESNKKIIGYTTFSSECSTWNASHYTHMDCLFLYEAFRGLGIGEALVNEIILHSKMENAHHIEWQTPVFNERAIRFYNRIGATSKEKLRFTLTF